MIRRSLAVLSAVLLIFLSGFAAFAPGRANVAGHTGSALGVPGEWGDNGVHEGEGRRPLYVVREIVETTSPFTNVVWFQAPQVIATRHEVLEGGEALDWYEVSGLTVRLSKKALDTTRVVIQVETLALRGDGSANLTIEKGALGYTRALLSRYDIAGGRFAPLGEFLNADPIDPVPFRFEIDLTPLYDLPAASANVARGVEGLDRRVLAFYYPWYGNPAGPSGKWVHWDESSPPQIPTAFSIAASAHYPLLGPYDSADEDVILAHMAMARDAGIDGFVSSWWGLGTFENELLDRILRVAEATGMNVTVYYETVRDRRPTQAVVVAELTYVIQTYASSPAFLRSEGKPVLFIYVAHQWSPDFWLQVRRAVESAVGPVVLIGDVFDDAYLQVFDGFHNYIYLDPRIDAFYGEARERLRIGLAASVSLDGAFELAYAGGSVDVHLKAFAVSASPGFDTSYWGPIGFKRDRDGGALYREYWRTAIAVDASTVLITSWNEWHEGTEIEPSREYGFEYIQLTRELVQQFKQRTLARPEVGYSVRILPFELRRDFTGEGVLVLVAGDQSPMIFVQIEIRGLGGVRGLDLNGDFHTYLKKRDADATSVSVVVPAVLSGEELTLRVAFAAGFWSTRVRVSVNAYDPAGTVHPVFEGEVEARGLTPTVLVAFFILAVVAALGLVVYLRRFGRRRRP